MKVIQKIFVLAMVSLFLGAIGSVSPCLGQSQEAIETVIGIHPETLNLKSKGKWVTCYVEAPEGCSVSDIEPASVIISHLGSHPVNIKSESYKMIENRDGDSELMMKYRSSEFISAIVGNNMENPVKVRVNGRLYDNTPFVGSAKINLLPLPQSEYQQIGVLLFYLYLLSSSTH